MGAKMRPAERWDNLKPSYRHTLERAGITRALYVSGAPLTAARRHATTPEHPERALRTDEAQEKYALYLVRYRERVALHVWDELRQALMDGRIQKLNKSTVVHYVNVASPEALKVLARADYERIAEYASEQAPKDRHAIPTDFTYPAYDADEGEWVNPFWYH